MAKRTNMKVLTDMEKACQIAKKTKSQKAKKHQFSAVHFGFGCSRKQQSQSNNQKALSARGCGSEILQNLNVPHICQIERQIWSSNANVINKNRLADSLVFYPRPLH